MDQIKFGSQNLAYSPDGNKLIVSNGRNPTLTIFNVDKATGSLIKEADIKTGKNPISIRYSPDGGSLLVADHDDNTLWIYEVDQDTGALNRITGDALEIYKRQKESAEAQRFLREEKLIPSEDVLSIMHSYITGEKWSQPKSLYEQTYDQARIEQAISKTARQSQSFEKDAAGLFKAITDDDQKAVQEYLTPFTINAPRGDNHRTALLEAAYLGKKNIIPILLDFNGAARYGVHQEEVVTVKLDAVDIHGNTALILAIVQGDIDSALMIAKKMTQAQRKMSNKQKETALILALRFEKKENISDAAKKKNAELIKLLQE